MDPVGVDSSSSSRSSPSSAGMNLCTVEHRPEMLDSSNSSEASTSPNPLRSDSASSQRRPSAGENARDEAYWEKRRRNNDAAKRSREREVLQAMEQRLIELAKENSILKSRLNQQQQLQQQQQQLVPQSSALQLQNTIPAAVQHDSVIVAGPKFDTPSLPAPSLTAFSEFAGNSAIGPPSKLPAMFPTHLLVRTPLISSGPAVSQATGAQPLPVLQICHLQAALQSQQYRTPPSTLISSGRGAFQPFHSSRDSSSSSTSIQRISPDSSTTEPMPVDFSTHDADGKPYLRYRIAERQPDIVSAGEQQSWSDNSLSPPQHSKNSTDQDEKPVSLLGSLLSTRRTSPLVPQSRTDVRSGLSNARQGDNDLKNCLSSLAVNLTTTKSDTDSMGSPSSNHSTSDSAQSQPSPASSNPTANSAIVKALSSRPSSKQQYMDRRRRNNEAAKRCRANRRAQFEMRSKRAQQLELENGELRKEMNRLKQELEQLKAMHAAKTAALQR
ncbi:Nuclear factor interleukin-3-regulated protein [Toxocara canis]|uniref:Nuclear factor interleukin-3-regulated protein n=1 Tax=Toxocara canis TaxID=6265 RepID=A0A0B2UZW0_TOXCA|nr:Nuclear factor interleukin-3-regulated protein [Toxocara canis]